MQRAKIFYPVFILILGSLLLQLISCAFEGYDAEPEFGGVELYKGTNEVSEYELIDFRVSVINSGTGRSGSCKIYISLVGGEDELEVISEPLLTPQIGVGESWEDSYRVLVPKGIVGAAELVFRLEHLGRKVDEERLAVSVSDIPNKDCEPNDTRVNAQQIDVLNQGYAGQISPGSDVDWYYVEVGAGKKLGTSVDGETGAVLLEFYLNDETNRFDYLEGDNFSQGLTYENTGDELVRVYVKVSSSLAKNYWILFEELK